MKMGLNDCLQQFKRLASKTDSVMLKKILKLYSGFLADSQHFGQKEVGCIFSFSLSAMRPFFRPKAATGLPFSLRNSCTRYFKSGQKLVTAPAF